MRANPQIDLRQCSFDTHQLISYRHIVKTLSLFKLILPHLNVLEVENLIAMLKIRKCPLHKTFVFKFLSARNCTIMVNPGIFNVCGELENYVTSTCLLELFKFSGFETKTDLKIKKSMF